MKKFYIFHCLVLIAGIPASMSSFYSLGDPISFNFLEFLETFFGILGFAWWVGMIVEATENKFLIFCRYYGLLFCGIGFLLTVISHFADISFRIIPLPNIFEYKSKFYSEIIYGLLFLGLLFNKKPKLISLRKSVEVNISLGWITIVIGTLNLFYSFILIFKLGFSNVSIEFFFYLISGAIGIFLGFSVIRNKYWAYMIMVIGYAVIAIFLLLFYQVGETFLGLKISMVICLLLPFVEFIFIKLKEKVRLATKN